MERITPSAQSEIDKKSYRELDHDFATTERAENSPERKRRIADKARYSRDFITVVVFRYLSRYFPSDTDSDFESPNLLVRSRKPLRPRAAPTIKENTVKKPDKTIEEGSKHVNKMDDEDFDLFVSRPVEENQVPKSVKTKSIKALNRWGIDKQSFDSLTDSEKKKFSSNRQSKIDVFFKNPPQHSSKDVVRVSHADMDMERALKMSRDAAMVKEEAMETSPDIIKKEEEESKIVDGVAKPKFAHVGPAVRGNEEYGKDFQDKDKKKLQERRKEKNCTGLTVLSVRSIINRSLKRV